VGDLREPVRAALADGPLTRRELTDAVRRRVKLPDHPQVPAWLTGVAALHGEIIEGPADRFVLFDDWLGPSPEPSDPAVELARRHARAHPPSAPEDFATWSGLPVREARRAYAELELDEVEVLGRTAFIPRGLEPAPPHVRLLPRFDGWLLGHRDRALIMREEHDKAVRPGGGILAATLVVDGRVEGTWKLERGRPEVTAFGDFDYAAEVEDVVRFRAREP
jgi:Winged helix DNA-binding domain